MSAARGARARVSTAPALARRSTPSARSRSSRFAPCPASRTSAVPAVVAARARRRRRHAHPGRRRRARRARPRRRARRGRGASPSSPSCSTSTRPRRRSPRCSAATRALRLHARPARARAATGSRSRSGPCSTQQISVRAGRTHAGRLVAAAGEPLARPRGTHHPPLPDAPRRSRDAPDGAFAMPARRRETLRSLAGVPLDELTSVPGDRAVDAGLREHARAARPRRLARHRPRRPQGARRPGPRAPGARTAPTRSCISGTACEGVCPQGARLSRPLRPHPGQSAAARRNESRVTWRRAPAPASISSQRTRWPSARSAVTSREEPEQRRARGQPRVEDAEREQDERHGERERGERDEHRRAAPARSAPCSQTVRALAPAAAPARARLGRLGERRAALGRDRAGGGDDLRAALGVAGEDEPRGAAQQPRRSCRPHTARRPSRDQAPRSPPGACPRPRAGRSPSGVRR